MPKSSSAPRGRRGTGAGPWGPMVDAAANVARAFSDPVAMEGVNALDTAGDAWEQMGRSVKVVGATIADEIDWDPRVARFFEVMGDVLIRAAKPARDGAAAVRRAEHERINNVEEGGSRRRRWDISAHDN